MDVTCCVLGIDSIVEEIRIKAGRRVCYPILSVESITKSGSLFDYEARLSKAGKRTEIKVDPAGKPITEQKQNGEQDENRERKEAKEKPKGRKS